MGKLNQGAFQGFIGKTGGLVGKRYQGKYIVSAYQPIVKNPKSIKQINQRSNFAIAIAYITNSFKSEIRTAFWKSFSGGLTGRASTIQTILRAVTFYNRYTPIQYSPVAPPSIRSGAISRGMFSRPDILGNWIKEQLPGTGYAINDALGSYEPGVKFFGSDIVLADFYCRIDYPEIIEGKLIWSTLRGEAPTQLDLQDKSTILFDTDQKVGGIKQSASECGSAWNYIYKFNDVQVFPIVPNSVNKTVFQGEDGNVLGGKWNDNQFIVSAEFLDGSSGMSEVGNPVIDYSPAP